MTRVVATHRLHLDHLCAKVGKIHAELGGRQAGNLENAHVVQKAHAFRAGLLADIG